MRKHYRIVVAGRVQGVFFRASAKATADQNNIKGFVRNEPSGNVYIEAEGEEKDLEQFINWCSEGPKAANVETCDIREGSIKGFTQFEILRDE